MPEYVMHVRFEAADDDEADDLVNTMTNALEDEGPPLPQPLRDYVSYEEVLP